MSVIGTDEVNLMAAHSLVTDPDAPALDVLQHGRRWMGRPLAYGSAHVQNFSSRLEVIVGITSSVVKGLLIVPK